MAKEELYANNTPVRVDLVTREDILSMAEKICIGDREEQYGKPENNFQTIADMWCAYLSRTNNAPVFVSARDVATMMILFKASRIASGQKVMDNWVDICGYAACGGEIQDFAEGGNQIETH